MRLVKAVGWCVTIDYEGRTEPPSPKIPCPDRSNCIHHTLSTANFPSLPHLLRHITMAVEGLCLLLHDENIMHTLLWNNMSPAVKHTVQTAHYQQGELHRQRPPSSIVLGISSKNRKSINGVVTHSPMIPNLHSQTI